VILGSYAKSLLPFVLSYGVLFGLGVGFAYQMPFITGGRWFPAKKGMVTGAIISGMGASAFVFNMLATALINPAGANPVDGAFPPEIYARWPSLLRTLGVCYAALAIIGGLLQANPPSFTGSYPLLDFFAGKKREDKPSKALATSTSAAPQRSVASDIFSRQFAIMWTMILFSAVSGLCVAGSYKTFGTRQPHLNSDKFLSLVGSASAILGNAAGRFFWGSLSDLKGFKHPFMVLTLIEAACMLGYTALAKSRITFAIATVLMLFCMGGNFAMFPAQTMRLYGANGASVYSVMFTAFGSAALLGPVLGNLLLSKGGFKLQYKVLGSMALVSFGLASQL